jgi:hypothetical protein
MRFLNCLYRGADIPRLKSPRKKLPCQLCLHPDVRGPCVIEAAGSGAAALLGGKLPVIDMGGPIRSCLGCGFWRDSEAVAKAKMADQPPLEPVAWSPPELPTRAVKPAKQPVLATRETANAPCIHLRQEEIRQVDCAEGCVSKLKVFPCWVHGECTIAKRGVGVAGCCGKCPDKEVLVPLEKLPLGPDGELVVNCDKHGLGDALIMAWIAEGAEGKVLLRANGVKRELLELFGQRVVPEGGASQSPMVSAEFRASYPARLPFRSAFLGIEGPPQRPKAKVSASARAWASQCISPETVILCPQSNHKIRERPMGLWVDLCEQLKSQVIPFLIVGRDPRFELSSYPGVYSLSPMERTVALFQQCRAVIGIDSFPVNLSGTLDVPTIALLTITNPNVFEHTPSVRCLPMTAEVPDILAELSRVPSTAAQ